MTETKLSKYFANPTTPDHKRYEALRALLFEKLPKTEVIEKFGYTEYTLPQSELKKMGLISLSSMLDDTISCQGKSQTKAVYGKTVRTV